MVMEELGGIAITRAILDWIGMQVLMLNSQISMMMNR